MMLGFFLGDCFFKTTLMLIEVVISSNKSCSKCFLIVFKYALNKQKELATSKEQINYVFITSNS